MEIIIIIGHGSVEIETGNIRYIAERLHNLIHAKCQKDCVRVAYLQYMKPDLMEAIEKSVQDGAEKIIIHPYFLDKGFHVKKNIPEIIKKAEEIYPEIEFVCTEPLGAHEKLAQVIYERIQEATDQS